ncbi:uncharacterized protein LOC143921549 isoform X1 [Arctopsyche grandis]|uniref:uncharacterized protein LOC143921549 isoform X1 n=1 Tax=Arctopsyche grandis TaxID=121162 RepID=UPI00406D9271
MKATKYTHALDRKLINLVKTNPDLYINSNKKYNSYLTRERIWQEIALSLNKTVPECKTRWRTIRDSYRKLKIKSQLDYKTGLPVFSRSKYNNKELKFLDGLINSTETSIDDTNETNEDDEYHLVEVVEDHQYSKSLLNTDENDNSNNVSPDNGINYMSVGSKEYDEYFLSYKKLQIKTESSSSSEPTLLTRPKCDSDTKPIEGSKDVREESKEILKCLLTEKQTSDNTEHPVDTFFRSMATTVKSFSPQLIAETRMKVCNIVSEMELRSLSECNPQSSCTFKHSSRDKFSNCPMSFSTPVISSVSNSNLSPSHIKDEVDASFEIELDNN